MGPSPAASRSNPMPYIRYQKMTLGPSFGMRPIAPKMRHLASSCDVLRHCGIGWGHGAIEPPPRARRRPRDEELKRVEDEQRQRDDAESSVALVEHGEKRESERRRLLGRADDGRGALGPRKSKDGKGARAACDGVERSAQQRCNRVAKNEAEQ